MSDDPRLELAQLPTPLESADRLSAAWGGPRVWIKRDDLTGFGLSGNKVRKLEYQFGAAVAAGATAVVTCGAVQSNHCRATALAAARLGLRCVLLLRSRTGHAPDEVTGNHLLQRLAGAEVRFITPEQYDDKRARLAAVAAELDAAGEVTRVIVEGASDRLGMVAFEQAMHELASQVEGLGLGARGPVTVWHASSSAGTTAGLALGAAALPGRFDIVGSSVGDRAPALTDKVHALLAEAGDPSRAAAPFSIVDDYLGLGYGRTTDDELRLQVEATRLTGLIWDPTYTGKALYALRQEIAAGRFGPDDQVVFWHTGGGFAAFAHDFGAVL